MRREFTASLPERHAALTSAWQSLTAGDWDDDSLDAAYRVVHSLAGACETFGISEPGQAARALNDHLHAMVQHDATPSREDRVRAEELYVALEQAMTEA